MSTSINESVLCPRDLNRYIIECHCHFNKQNGTTFVLPSCGFYDDGVLCVSCYRSLIEKHSTLPYEDR